MSDAATITRLELPPLVSFVERDWGREAQLQRIVRDVGGIAKRSLTRRRLGRRSVRTAAAGRCEAKFQALSEDDLTTAIAALRERLALARHRARPTGRDMALLRETARRTLGLRAHDVQLVAAVAVTSGKVVEMATGEGKTLVAALASAWKAMAGMRVHVITVNDYLADRDARTLKPFFDRLGLRVGVVVSATVRNERPEAYRAPVCYCTNKELAFDYLRQTLAGQGPGASLHRRIAPLTSTADAAPALTGLEFAIVDEADSVLVDEARTPLILSDSGDEALPGPVLERIMAYARKLAPGRDYDIDFGRWAVNLTSHAEARLDEAFAHEPRGLLAVPRLREELVRQALMALHLYRSGEHYLVRDGKIVIVDEYTGRLMPDRSWRIGLHQMVEFKEGCEITQPLQTRASMTYQRFFRRYVGLSGMSGTAREISRELWNVYGLDVVIVPPNRRLRRKVFADRVYATETAKWKAVVRHIARLNASGQPVLVGCRTVAASRRASALLADAGLEHDVLNADEEAREATIIARAGEKGRITIATNMAGRGTDIVLGTGVADLGGLHVVLTERHDARRIDRQLEGRCARQGDVGSFAAMLSLEDRLVALHGDVMYTGLCRLLCRIGIRRPGRRLIATAQRKLEKQHSRIREELLRADRGQQDLLALSGAPE